MSWLYDGSSERYGLDSTQDIDGCPRIGYRGYRVTDKDGLLGSQQLNNTCT